MEHTPFVYTPDPSAVREEVTKLREKVAEETSLAETALAQGQRQKAALCYASVLEVLEEICELAPTDENWLFLAQSSWDLSSFRDVGIEEIVKRDLKGRAGLIWRDFYEKTRLPLYRKKAEEAGELLLDPLDYSADENYLARRIPDLAELTMVLEQYDVFENDDGEIMIAIHVLPQGDETQAVLFCDGGKHAILFKGPYRLIICDFLHPKIRKKLPRRESVLCYEDQNPIEEKGEYMARVVYRPQTSDLAQTLLHRLKKI